MYGRYRADGHRPGKMCLNTQKGVQNRPFFHSSALREHRPGCGRLSKCAIRHGGASAFGNGITYSHDDRSRGSSCNEILSTEVGDQSLSLKPMGMSSMMRGADRVSALSSEGAAEFCWGMLMEPLQRKYGYSSSPRTNREVPPILTLRLPSLRIWAHIRDWSSLFGGSSST